MKKQISTLLLVSLLSTGANNLFNLNEGFSESDKVSYKVYQNNTYLGSFPSEDDAIAEAKKWAGSNVMQNGTSVWSFANLFRVSQYGVSLGTFNSLEKAITEAKRWAGSTVTQSGTSVWSFADLYRVSQYGVSLGTFNSLEKAIAEAKRWAGSTVTQNGTSVWSFADLYRVSQYGVSLGTFDSLEKAIAEAKRWAGSTVTQNGTSVWSFANLYRVFQKDVFVGNFDSLELATTEAKRWSNSTVVQNGKVIWKFADLYRVFQGNAHLGDFDSLDLATTEAKRWNNSTVVQNGKAVWKFADLYRVFQGNVHLGDFDSLDLATTEAKRWSNSTVVQNGKAVWKFADYMCCSLNDITLENFNGREAVVLKFDRAPNYSILNNLSNKVGVDLKNTKLAENLTEVSLSNNLIESVRTGSHPDNISRVVIDIKPSVTELNYNIEVSGNNIIVYIGGNILSSAETISYTQYNMSLDQMVSAQSNRLSLTDMYRYRPAYVHKTHIQTINGIIGTVIANNVPVMEQTNGLSFMYGTLKMSTSVTILGKVGDWYQIQYNYWRNAKPDDICYFLNPDNFGLDTASAFQFLDLSKSAGISASELNDKVLVNKGALSQKGNAFIEAGKLHGVNEIYLVSHAFLETGYGSSELATGVLVDWLKDKDGKPREAKVVYNMFGIGAIDSNPLRGGAETAYNKGWFSPEEAIIGGAKFIGEGYLNRSGNRQNTIYKMRWNPDINYIWHQYATDIGWAYKQVNNMKSLYDLCSSYTLNFDIPVYKK